MSILSAIISRGTAAAQPAATTLPAGSIYFQTDTGLIQRSNGTTWDTFSAIVFTGDSGAGGTTGLVAAPPSGSAAAGKFLKADATWAVPPGSGGSGKIAQIVNTETGAVATGTTIVPFDNTIPQNTEGDQYMSLSITPTSATSHLMIDVVFFGTLTGTPWLSVALFQDATANALAAVTSFIWLSTTGLPIVMRHYMVSGTTSATTFKVRAGPSSAATLTFNGQSTGRIFGGVMASSITITEVLP